MKTKICFSNPFQELPKRFVLLTYRILLLSTLVFTLSILLSCNNKNDRRTASAKENKTYTCPMHPQVVSDKPGSCPICGMDLVPVTLAGTLDQELMLNENQVRLANITTQPIQSEPMGNTTLVTGRLVLNEDQTEIISSRVNGRIEKLYIKEVGEKISKGQKLYEVFSEQLLTLQNEYLLALRQANEFKANERYNSFLEASKKKLLLLGIPQSEIEKIAVNNKAESRITFTAPYSGYVAEMRAAEGQYVAEGGVLYRIEKLNKMWVEADLYPREANLVKEGDQIRVTVNGFENEPVKGKVNFLGPQYKKGSQIITLRAEIENQEGKFQPGMQANVLLVNSSNNALAIPVDAVLRDGKGSHVWVQAKEGIFQPRVVKTGMENFDKIEILEGLKANERVVVTGAYLLYSEFVLKKGGDPLAGHHHSSTLSNSSIIESEQMNEKKNTTASATSLAKQIPGEFKNQLRSVLLEYYKIGDALVKSDPSEASNAALSAKRAIERTDMKLLKGKEHLMWMKDLELINNSLIAISTNKELEKQRIEFGALSKALHNSVKEFGVTDSVIYYQFCPMALQNKGAYWLSNKEEISNPYFGEKMLRCGETVEVLEGAQSSKQ